MRARRNMIGIVLAGLTGSLLTAVGVAAAPTASAAQPVPGHTRLVPDVPRTNTPRISTGEIWDMEVVPQLNRVFIAGSFTSIANSTGGSAITQRYLASYNYNTGAIDTAFRPLFNGGVSAVEASPDGTKLYVAGSFNTVNGVARQKIASLDLTTGAPIAGFAVTASTNNQATALAATNTTLYVGGKFTRVNGQLRTGLAALNGVTGAVDLGFDNQISGGIGVDGVLTVQQLKLTHDDSKLLVLHTGRKIAGQDRYGVGLISTTTKTLLPWRTRLWEDNLVLVGGVQRAYSADIAPNDQYFVVGSGSGGDRPPINDMAIAFPIAGNDGVAPIWNSRHFDSVYSIAITERAVYVGGHFGFQESPTANQPWPGLDNVGYGTGQGLSGYGLGEQVVRRDHLGALDPATGTALEWSPGSNSFEGNKAMEATARGLFVGGDGQIQGGKTTGRVAFYDFNSLPAASPTDTTIINPIEGRVVSAGQQFVINGTGVAPGGVRRVQVEIQDRNSKQYLQDDMVTWGAVNNIYAQLGTATGTSAPWSLPVTVTGQRTLQVMAKTYGLGGTNDATKAIKKFESFNYDDLTPDTGITAPASGLLTTSTFVVNGTASDDKGVNSITYYIKDVNNQFLQEDGSVASSYNTFRGTPDVVGATAATWQFEITVPHEGEWTFGANAVDSIGQADLRSAARTWIVSTTGVAPSVSISSPAAMQPPTAAATLTVPPGGQMTFSGSAIDDAGLRVVEISLRNTTTRENLAADGSWGTDVIAGFYEVSPPNLPGTAFAWSYTTPFTLSPGQYSFTVRAIDDLGLVTSTVNQGRLTINAQVAGDLPPNGLLNFIGTDQNINALHLDLAGTATDDFGVAGVRVSLRDSDSGRYVQPNNTMGAAFATVNATLASPGALSSSWTLPIDLPAAGDFAVTAYAVDSSGQLDISTVGATARYLVFPGDADPTLSDTLSQPVDGAAFTESRVVVTGRALDDIGIGSVQVAIVNSLNQYMSATGTFTSTTESWRGAFVNSPGSVGSNFSYTTPVIPTGTYKVRVRVIDNKDQVMPVPRDVTVTVSAPAGNLAPVARASVSCNANVCSFDGRTSTDENAPTLTYSWVFTGPGTGATTGSVPTRTYTAAGTSTAMLTVTDEYGATSSTALTVTMTEPTGNVAPTPVINAPSCSLLVCNISGVGSLDPNVGDSFTYLWSFGDLTPTSPLSAVTHTFPAAGTYTLTLTTTDGWGRAASVTRSVTVSAT